MSLSFPLLALPLSILTRRRHMNTGDHIKSIEALQRALVIREEALGAGHPAVADILVNLIAAMRLSAEKMPLAQGWEHKEDAEGKSYWYNPGKQTVQYDRPLPDAFCDGSGGRTLKDLEIRLCSLESQSSMSANLSSSDVLLGLQARCPPPCTSNTSSALTCNKCISRQCFWVTLLTLQPGIVCAKRTAGGRFWTFSFSPRPPQQKQWCCC